MQDSTQNTQETILFGKISKWIAQKLDEKKAKANSKDYRGFLAKLCRKQRQNGATIMAKYEAKTKAKNITARSTKSKR